LLSLRRASCYWGQALTKRHSGLTLALADRLQENNLAAVRILPKRFAELERNQPYVAFIGITPIAKG
jgi:hypothetical protein